MYLNLWINAIFFLFQKKMKLWNSAACEIFVLDTRIRYVFLAIWYWSLLFHTN